MKKYVEWILAHKMKSGLIILGLFLFPLLAIHFLYKWQTPNPLLQSCWSSGDLIMYISSFIAFGGSLIVSMLAIMNAEDANRFAQNANKLNIRLLALEERQEKIERVPYIYLKNAFCCGVHTYANLPAQLTEFFELPITHQIEGEYLCIRLTLVNVSKICSYIHFIDYSLQEGASEIYLKKDGLSNMKTILLLPNETYTFDVFLNTALFDTCKDATCFISVDAINHFKEIYRQYLYFKISSRDKIVFNISLDKHYMMPWENYDQDDTNANVT